MPVTPAHLVVAVPAWRDGRWWAAALAAGALAPDLAHLVPLDPDGSTAASLRSLTHGLWAAFTVDVVLGLGLLVIGVGLVWPACCDLGPAWIVRRAGRPPARPRDRTVLLLGSALAVLVGVLSHVALDRLSHADVYGSWTLPEFGVVSGAKLVQVALSFAGVIWLTVETIRFARRPAAGPPPSASLGRRVLVWVAVVAVGVGAGIGRLGEFASPRDGIRLYGTMASQLTLRAVSVTGILVVFVAAVRWGITWSKRRRGERHAGGDREPAPASR